VAEKGGGGWSGRGEHNGDRRSGGVAGRDRARLGLGSGGVGVRWRRA
jgi:hypothetical protein